MRTVHALGGSCAGGAARATGSLSSHTVSVSGAAAIARSRRSSPARTGATAEGALPDGRADACRHGLERAGGPSQPLASATRRVSDAPTAVAFFL
jgi:hypothetical protein